MYYSNTNAVSISTTVIQPIYLGITAVNDTNLTCLISIYGVASVVNTLTINIQLDNNTISFVPKQKLQQGDNVIGIPLGIPQVQAGSHYIGINLSVDTGTFTIPAFNCQCMLDGRNLQGGLSAAMPHAEVSETVNYVPISYNNKIQEDKSCILSIMQPNIQQINEHVASNLYDQNTNISGIPTITLS
jgi:hypothetical protein